MEPGVAAQSGHGKVRRMTEGILTEAAQVDSVQTVVMVNIHSPWIALP